MTFLIVLLKSGTESTYGPSSFGQQEEKCEFYISKTSYLFLSFDKDQTGSTVGNTTPSGQGENRASHNPSGLGRGRLWLSISSPEGR